MSCFDPRPDQKCNSFWLVQTVDLTLISQVALECACIHVLTCSLLSLALVEESNSLPISNNSKSALVIPSVMKFSRCFVHFNCNNNIEKIIR